MYLLAKGVGARPEDAINDHIRLLEATRRPLPLGLCSLGRAESRSLQHAQLAITHVKFWRSIEKSNLKGHSLVHSQYLSTSSETKGGLTFWLPTRVWRNCSVFVVSVSFLPFRAKTKYLFGGASSLSDRHSTAAKS